MTKIHNISVFSPGKKESFLFDTNVLIKIFYPALGAHNSAPYIKFYEQLIKQNTSLLLSSIQLSEFVNRCIRFQFDLYKKTHPEIKSFKDDYRDTNDYRESMDAILEIIKADIFPYFTRIDDKFSSMNPGNILMHSFSYDFNDAIIAEISRLSNAFLVTDDKDYINFLKDLNIVTNNSMLLRFQPR